MEQSISEGIGQKGVQLIANLKDTGKRVFRTEDALKALEGNQHAVNILLSKLEKKGLILRLERGKYLIIPPEAWKSGEYLEEGIVLASSLISPYYLSFWTALNYYGFTEQPSRTIFIATQKVKVQVNIKGLIFKFVKISPTKFFGFESLRIGDQVVNIATQEKTIIDCLDQPRYCGEITEAAKGIWNGRNEINWPTLLNDALRMNNSAILKRLGFIMESLGIKKAAVIRKLQENIGQGYSLLEPNGNRNGKYNRRWRLLLNVPVDSITEWRKH